MKIDLARADPNLIRTDVAIIGAGAAGLTAARSLIDGGRQVTLLESGGLDYSRDTADLNIGENIGQQYYDLDEARLRFFGGTTAIWGGRCAELDPIDFERRDWVAHSGWPITWDEIQPWYGKARRLLGVDADRISASWLERADLPALEVDHWSFDSQFDRFAYRNHKDLVAHPRMTLILHATVRELVSSEDGRRVDRLEVVSPTNQRLTVEANVVILAAGGLENPRILLASNRLQPAGLGNQHDLVGRFFMEHPHARGGRVVNAPVWKLLDAFRQRTAGNLRTATLLKLRPEVQRERHLLNSAITLAARPRAHGFETALKRVYLHARHSVDPTRAGRFLWQMYRRSGRALTKLTGPVAPWMNVKRGRTDLTIVVRAEQAPNFDSRVLLSNETDAVGMPRIKLDWRLQEVDVRTISKFVDCLENSFASARLGSVEKAEWLKSQSSNWESDPLISSHPLGGYHHMGTTRMSADPRQGVTDKWGKVHDVDNLYICGSSLFPTSGWANPTLTILALALRTSDGILNNTI